jgi:hypothetical protein
MARISGKAGQVWADTGVVTEADVILGVTSWEMDQKGAADDTTGMDSGGAKEFIGGLTEGTGSVEAFADGALDAHIVVGGLISVNLLYADGDTDCWYGSAIVTQRKPTVQVDGAVKWSIQFQYTSTIAYGVIPT